MMIVLPRTSLLAGLVAALCSSAVVGQTYFYAPSDTPAAGTCNVFPWGQSSTRHQHVVTAAELGNSTQSIRDIAYAACASGTFTASQIVIQMDHFQGTTLSPTFAANLGTNPVTVLNATNWSYAYTLDAWADVGLTNAFNYDPSQGNLLIDIEFCGAGGGSSFHRDVAPRCWNNGGPCPSVASGTSSTGALKVRIDTGTGGTYSPFGQGCGNPALTLTGIGVPNLGLMSSVTMSNGAPGQLGVYGASFTPTSLDLTSAGAPGCFAYTDPLVVTVTAFDGVGNAVTTFDIGLPNIPALLGVSFVHASASVDPSANALGVKTSNGLTATVGM
jgi:hypothetical protein